MPPLKQQPKNLQNQQYQQNPKTTIDTSNIGIGISIGTTGGKKHKAETPDFIRVFRLHKYYNDRFEDFKGSGPALGLDMPVSYYLDANPRRVSVKFFYELLHQRLGLSITRISEIVGQILRVGNLDLCSLPALIQKPFDFTRGQNKLLTFRQARNISDTLGLSATIPMEDRLISWLENWITNPRNSLNSVWQRWSILEPVILSAYANGCVDDDMQGTGPSADPGLPPLDITIFAKKYLKIKKVDPESNILYATTRELYAMETEINDSMRELFFDASHSPRYCSRFASRDKDELGVKLTDMVDDFQSRRGIEFLPAQLDAIRGCCLNQLGIIIGQPGTGKSTIAECITECLYTLGCGRICLTAISGQAVGQIKSKCSMVCTRDEKLCGTVDKLLFTVFPSLGLGEQPSVIIIDEFSMVDIAKWQQLLKYIQKFKCQVILIGDAYQLPSIGAGQLLATICQYPTIYPVFPLRDIMRQTGHLSKVIHRMTSETITKADFNNLDFILEDFDGGPETTKFITGLIDRYGLNKTNARFLCSQTGGSCGITQINRILQNIYNPTGADLPKLPMMRNGGGNTDGGGDGYQNFRIGDIVIRRTNDYLKNADQNIIYLNGDCGILTRYYNIMQQRVDPKLYQIDYQPSSSNNNSIGMVTKTEIVTLEELHENFTVGYALSVHRAQGSQYTNIVVLMTSDQKFMWINPQCEGFNLLYTAVSRASDRCIIAGKYGYFVDSQRGRTRKSDTPKRLSICCHPRYMFKGAES